MTIFSGFACISCWDCGCGSPKLLVVQTYPLFLGGGLCIISGQHVSQRVQALQRRQGTCFCASCVWLLRENPPLHFQTGILYHEFSAALKPRDWENPAPRRGGHPSSDVPESGSDVRANPRFQIFFSLSRSHTTASASLPGVAARLPALGVLAWPA